MGVVKEDEDVIYVEGVVEGVKVCDVEGQSMTPPLYSLMVVT